MFPRSDATEVRETVRPQLDKLETIETRRAFWRELLSRFPHLTDDLRATTASDSDEAPLALTPNQTLVIGTMARFDGSRLLSAAAIEEEMGPSQRLSARTIGSIVRRLMKLGLAERPEGERSGARLTTKGRRLAPKIAD